MSGSSCSSEVNIIENDLHAIIEMDLQALKDCFALNTTTETVEQHPEARRTTSPKHQKNHPDQELFVPVLNC
jgi:hypothetical protein